MKEQKIKQDKIRWILNDSVCIIDDKGYALTPNLRTVCIGTEEEIIKRDNDEHGISKR